MSAHARVRECACLSLLALLALALACAPARASEFGIEAGSFSTALSGDAAGEHADLTTRFTLNQEPAGDPTGHLRAIGVALPHGLIGDATATPECAMGDVVQETCPSQAAVGVAEITTAQPPEFESVQTATVLVYNIAPYPGEPAAYALDANSLPIRLDTRLPVENGYGLTMTASDLSDARPMVSAAITLWGVPADHNGPGPLETTQCHTVEVEEEEEVREEEVCVKYGGPGVGPRLPFLSNPVSCGTELTSSLSADSWQGAEAEPAEAHSPAMTECEGLQFEPSISVKPEKPEEAQARAPAGYEIAVKLPGNQLPAGRAPADLRSARVTLPPGTVISPSGTSGLQACPESQFDLTKSTPGECPPASRIGSTTIATPLLAKPLEGEVFLGSPECAPCTGQDAQEGKMIRVLVRAAGSGVLVKLAGSISVDQATGRLTVAIEDSPQLPVEELKLTLDGGPRALLANPSECGVALRGTAQLTPYSSAVATEVAGSAFQLSGCQAPQFKPAFTGGTVSNAAAATGPAIVSIGRTDQDQSLERFTVRMAPGLLGLLSRVPACPQAAVQAGTCPASSRVGTVAIAAGPGPEPLQLRGAAFLTGPHGGAPFGLSIVVPAQAGPIDLGTIDIGAGIEVDPTTAALTIASDALPQSLAGIPLQIRALNLDIDREGFMVHPTSCRPWAIDATLTGAQGGSMAASDHFQMAGCAKLPFKPTLTALADARTTRLGGAYVHLKLTSGAGQANIAKLKLDLPKALPSRLTTLQGACLEKSFKADPASCPASSILGTGAVTTPFLRGLLSGPIYLVSHGGRAFPELEAVLQGEGVTLILAGTAGFSGGIASEAFRSLPDAPISTLDLMFPRSAHSAFAANANLCKRTLDMPTAITGQNGAVMRQTTRIAVAGCPGGRRAKGAMR